MRLSLIAAVGKNGVIGRDNRIPWKLPSDLKRFKALTVGHPVIMGRKTFQSIGRPLPRRDNIVVSRHGFAADGAVVTPSVETALERAADVAGLGDEVFVIGGADIYRQTLPLADRLYITEVDASPPGEAHFPEIDRAIWREVRRQIVTPAEGDSTASAFVIYDRIGRPAG